MPNPSVVATATAGFSSGSTISVPKPTGATTGMGMYAWLDYDSNGSITVSDYGGWTHLGTVQHLSPDFRFALLVKTVGASEPSTTTITFSSSTWRTVVVALVEDADPALYSAFGSDLGDDDTINIGPVNVPAGSALLCGVGSYDGRTLAETGFTQIAHHGNIDVVALEGASADAAYSFSGIISTTNAYGAFLVVVGPVTGSSTTPYQDVVLADAPTAYWRLGEPSGTTASDSSGAARHATYGGSPGPTLGQPGGLVGDANTAVGFNGSTSYAVYTSVPQTANANWTIECWVKPSTLSQTGGVVLLSVGSDAGGYSLAMSNPANYGQAGVGIVGIINGVGWFNSGQSFVDTTTWRHIVARRAASNANVDVFIDGVKYATGQSLGASTPVHYTTIGCQETSAHTGTYFRVFNGLIDEAAVYNTLLSDTRILAHYNAGITDPAPGVVPQRWTGSAWVPTTTQRWTGSAWVAATVKRWDGSGWV